jgi:hypothetical protein
MMMRLYLFSCHCALIKTMSSPLTMKLWQASIGYLKAKMMPKLERRFSRIDEWGEGHLIL